MRNYLLSLHFSHIWQHRTLAEVEFTSEKLEMLRLGSSLLGWVQHTKCEAFPSGITFIIVTWQQMFVKYEYDSFTHYAVKGW